MFAISWLTACKKLATIFLFCSSIGKMLTKKQKSVDNSEQTLLSPLSSKWNWEVMRSIDPDHYRNVELEVWEESRKGEFLNF